MIIKSNTLANIEEEFIMSVTNQQVVLNIRFKTKPGKKEEFRIALSSVSWLEPKGEWGSSLTKAQIG